MGNTEGSTTGSTPIPEGQVTEKSASDTERHEAEGHVENNPPSNPHAVSPEEAQTKDMFNEDFTIETDAEVLTSDDEEDPDDGLDAQDLDDDGEPDEDEEV